MALVNQNNRYIKVNSDGTYDIYATPEDRDRVKNATPFETICEKYRQVLTELEADDERQYYDTKAWDVEYSGWYNEYSQYLYDHQMAKGPTTYPLMQTFFSDVPDSIPNIVQKGSIMIQKDTASEVYEIAKEGKYWGETEDV